SLQNPVSRLRNHPEHAFYIDRVAADTIQATRAAPPPRSQDPDHWDPSWERPSASDLVFAEYILNVFAQQGPQKIGQLFAGTGFAGDFRARSGALRGMFYRYPDLAATILASFGYNAHSNMAEILAPLEPSFLAALINRALSQFPSHAKRKGKYWET